MAECTACGVRKGGKSRVQETESEQLVRSSGFSVAPMGVSSADTNPDGPMDETAPARNRNHEPDAWLGRLQSSKGCGRNCAHI
eukprot:scaffold45777_cov75-Phaeocystis_antarctica.AAC.4